MSQRVGLQRLLPFLVGLLSCSDSASPSPDVAKPAPDNTVVSCGPSTCPTGCCYGETCQQTSATYACGSGGAKCVDCGRTGGTCSGGKCVGGCNATTCSSGCCDGATCVSPVTDTRCGGGGSTCESCLAKGLICAGSKCAECSFDAPGCADTKYCDVGTCVACPAGRRNCDGKGQCECEGTCSGTSCTGTTSCDYYDKTVCGGDTTKWCWNNACIACSSGFNCNKTKGCECDAKGCNGDACAGSCSGGECP
jgi:hypothetical protein